MAAIDGNEEPGGRLLTAYLMAAGRAADGRDAIAAAPSLPASSRPRPGESRQDTPDAAQLACLSSVIANRLAEYAGLAETVRQPARSSHDQRTRPHRRTDRGHPMPSATGQGRQNSVTDR